MTWAARITLCLCVALCGGPVRGQVVMRGGEPAPPGEVAGVSLEGVLVASGPDDRVLIGWDRVSRVEGEWADEAAAFSDVSDRAWRARSRLIRGDMPAAEPLFEELFPRYEGRIGPTAALVAEGLLRCRLRRGAVASAVPAWLATLNAVAGRDDQPRPLHADWSRLAGLAPSIDPQTGLCPALPPIWLDWPAVQAFAGASAPQVGGDAAPAAAEKVEMLRSLYAHAARFECGTAGAFEFPQSEDQGVRLVVDIVQARTGDAAARAEAKSRLQARLAEPAPGWVQAWCRCAIGRSLVREPDERQRRLGVIELLWLPATHDRGHPYLTGLALAEAAATLDELGDAGGAAVLRREFETGYKGHPASEWKPRDAARGARGSLAPKPATLAPGPGTGVGHADPS